MAEVSVIMPAYNVEQTIDDSIQSVRAQTFEDWELIIVNDGSTDNTEKRILEWEQKDSRIRHIRQTNQGVSVARNVGLEQAQGKFVSFLDADDIWLPELLIVLHSFLACNPDINFVYGKTREIFTDGSKQLVGPPVHNGYLEDFIHKNNELRLAYHISAVLIVRKTIMGNGIRFEPGIRVSEDTGFFIELMCVTKAYGLSEILSEYVRREGSATGGKKWKPEDWYGQVGIYFKIDDFVKEHRPEAFAAFKRMRDFVVYRYILHCIRNGYIKEAQRYIADWQKYLREFVNNKGRVNDRIKCRLMLCCGASEKLLQLLGCI